MNKKALTAIASIALPLVVIPLPAHSQDAKRIPSEPAGGRSNEAVMELLSMDAYRAGAARVRAASTTSIRPAHIAIIPPPVAIDAPRPVAKTAKKATVRVAPRVKAAASRSATRSSADQTSSGGGWRTIASWYDDRPSACWDKRGRHAFPRGLRAWTAHKTLPCGTPVAVSGPTGSMTVRVYDRGPYVKGRSLDLSAAVFRAVCGSTSRGVCRVTYRVAA